MKLVEAKSRARKLQIPRAVAAKSVGKKTVLAKKLILKVHDTPNFAKRMNR